MRDETGIMAGAVGGKTSGYRIAVVTLDAHVAGPVQRVAPALSREFPGLSVSVHAAAEWAENPGALIRAKAAVNAADMVISNLLFIEEHVQAILPELTAARARSDAFIGMIADPAIIKLTRMGDLDMGTPASGVLAMLRKLKGSKEHTPESGERQMKMLRRLPKILRFIPGKAQDLRAWFLTMQYWLGGSDDNIREMVRYLVGRYAKGGAFAKVVAKAPVEYPDVGVYHPAMKGRIGTDARALPRPVGAKATVGLLLLRSYVLAGDTAHYDAVITAFETKGMAVIPAFAAGLDGRPAMDAYHAKVDTLVSLTGFSLVGGPAYNDSPAAVAALSALDVPYVAAHPLEFQTLDQWEASATGLGPVETTMLIALPEIDGATNPTVFAGRRDVGEARAMAPCMERVQALADKVARLAALRRSDVAKRKVGIVLYGFPPNAGAAGTAAYLSVFESLFNTLHAMKADGYELTPPATVEALREAVLGGNAKMYGQPANVAAFVPASDMVRDTPWLAEVEAAWGPAPGRIQSDGARLMVLGCQFGNVFVGLQPLFGYEGDPMRLLFERSFAPTHAFVTFYRWLRTEFRADALLHFGMHGALEFMPGKQAGVSGECWPDRLIGRMRSRLPT
jgi:magnesium chelatase subunit H